MRVKKATLKLHLQLTVAVALIKIRQFFSNKYSERHTGMNIRT